MTLGCDTSPETPTHSPEILDLVRAPLDIETDRVVAFVLETTIAAAGSVRARRESSIGAEVPGRILEVRVDVGDSVEAGDALFRIDPVPYEMALREATAGLSLAHAELENARAEEARVERLVEKRAVSIRSRDDSRTAAAVAGARVAQMEARVARSRTELERTTARAPYAGSVVERLAHEGTMAGHQPIVVLQESGEREVVLDIPEATLVPVRVGDRVRIYASGLTRALESAISRVSRRVDPATRTYEVRALIAGSQGVLKPGSFVRADVVVAPSEARPVVARDALLLRDGRTFVFVVEGDTVRRIAVRTGARTDLRVEVLSGVEVGALVARGEVIARLVDGDRIRRAEIPVAAIRPEAHR